MQKLSYFQWLQGPNQVRPWVGRKNGSASSRVARHRGRIAASSLVLMALLAQVLSVTASAAAAVTGHVQTSSTMAAGGYAALPPARILDTRGTIGGFNGTAVGAGKTITVSVAGLGGVPATGASAVLLNVTVTGSTSSGYLTVSPDGTARPTVSNLNFSAGQTVPNLVAATLGADGKINIYNGSGGTVHVIADVAGYFTGGAPAAGGYAALPPARILDTRGTIGGFNGTAVGAGKTITVSVAGLGGVPATGASAVLLNVTVTGSTSSGYLTVSPDGTARPTVSNLNFSAGQTVPNLVAATLGADGKINIYNGSGGTVHVIADVAGYFTGGAPAAGGYAALPPARILDTRGTIGGFNGTAVGAGKTITVSVAGLGGVPATGASAVLLNVTVTGSTSSGYLTVSPDGTARPTVSNLNFSAGQTVPNLVAATLGADGKINIYNGSGGTVHVIADVAGYFTGGTDGDIDNYLLGLNPITAGPTAPEHPVGPATTSTSDPLPDPTAPSGSRRYQCTQTPYSLATSPEKIVAYNPDANKLWLGGLLQGQGYADGLGSLRELPIRKRAPLTIHIDLLGRQISTTVTNPDPAAMQQAISDLVNRAIATHDSFPSIANFNQLQAQSTSQALLSLGFSAKYIGVDGSAKLESSRTAQQSTLLATFEQRMFTVSITTPSTPSAYFSSDFTKADLDAQVALGRISPDNPPVVVASISYGRTLIYSATASASTDELSGAVSAAFNGGAASGSVQVTGRQQEILNSTEWKVLSLGGADEDTRYLIRDHKLGDYFTNQSNPLTAVPISYQVDNIKDNSAAKFTETSNYNLTECAPLDNQRIVVGATVRMTKPFVYMDGNRGHADIYGSLVVNGNTQWSRPRNAPQIIQLHNQTELDGWRQPDVTQVPWQLNLYANQSPSLTISGSINCRLYFPEIGDDPSNQYNWQWRLSSGAYGNVQIQGGSRSCPITLRTQVTKVADLYEYRP